MLHKKKTQKRNNGYLIELPRLWKHIQPRGSIQNKQNLLWIGWTNIFNHTYIQKFNDNIHYWLYYNG